MKSPRLIQHISQSTNLSMNTLKYNEIGIYKGLRRLIYMYRVVYL